MKIKRNQSLESHFPLGVSVVLIAALFGVPPVLAFFTGFAVGVAVELVQGAFPALGAAEMQDVVYTAAGAATGFALLMVA